MPPLQKWNKDILTYYLRNPLSEGKFDRSRYAAELEKAFGAWSEVANLKFRKAHSYAAADIKIDFGSYKHGECKKYGRNFDFDGRLTFNGRYVTGDKLAHAYPPQHCCLKGILHFDADEPWTTEKGNKLKPFY